MSSFITHAIRLNKTMFSFYELCIINHSDRNTDDQRETQHMFHAKISVFFNIFSDVCLVEGGACKFNLAVV